MGTTLHQLEAVVAIFSSFPFQWFVSGGWAIDLFRGEVTREHEDLEIGILRRDQRAVRFLLQESHALAKVVETRDGPDWVPWYEGEFLELPIHQVRASAPDSDPPEFELFLNDTEGDQWFFRRNAEIRRPATTLASTSKGGIPYLRPEIQLLYKARLMRSRDVHDFTGCVRLLQPEARAWLRRNLEDFLPGHEWLAEL